MRESGRAIRSGDVSVGVGTEVAAAAEDFLDAVAVEVDCPGGLQPDVRQPGCRPRILLVVKRDDHVHRIGRGAEDLNRDSRGIVQVAVGGGHGVRSETRCVARIERITGAAFDGIQADDAGLHNPVRGIVADIFQAVGLLQRDAPPVLPRGDKILRIAVDGNAVAAGLNDGVVHVPDQNAGTRNEGVVVVHREPYAISG